LTVLAVLVVDSVPISKLQVLRREPEH